MSTTGALNSSDSLYRETCLHISRSTPRLKVSIYDSLMITVPETLTAGVYVLIGTQMPFMVGPTPDGKRLAVIRLGGHCERGETSWQCAAREAREEASLTITAVAPPATFWLHSSDDPSELVEQPCPAVEDDVPPLLVVEDDRTSPRRRSVMYSARSESVPVPAHEAKGLLMLTADEAQRIVRGGMTLGAYLDAGGRASFSTPLSPDLVLEPFLHLRILARLLEHYPLVRKAIVL
jgi:8-oxo-dGTP pyrophosphatase MutT (NUDIX family)